jgi:hypothetical protein
MTAPAQSTNFATANPHALATIREASQTKRIIASRDIFDLQGIKLWARDQPVSETLQRKLLDRKLRQPLESCLLAEDGVTAHSLVQATAALIERGKQEFDEIYIEPEANPPIVLDGKADDVFEAIIKKRYRAIPFWEPGLMAACDTMC